MKHIHPKKAITQSCEKKFNQKKKMKIRVRVLLHLYIKEQGFFLGFSLASLFNIYSSQEKSEVSFVKHDFREKVRNDFEFPYVLRLSISFHYSTHACTRSLFGSYTHTTRLHSCVAVIWQRKALITISSSVSYSLFCQCFSLTFKETQL